MAKTKTDYVVGFPFFVMIGFGIVIIILSILSIIFSHPV